MGLILTLIIGGVIGWIASMIMKTDVQMGWVANVIAGIVGSWLGTLLLGTMLGPGAPTASGISLFSILVSIIGACIAIYLWQLLSGARNL